MSRFVSAGAINAETGEAVVAEETKKGDDGAGGAVAAASTVEPRKNAEWEIVQRELEAERKRREEARLKSVEGGERSLYDVLQANKAAKQAAFEEANKIKNQFRALDDDEIDFLDEVRAAKRAEEERVRRETEEGLAAFRRAQEGGGVNLKRPGGGDVGDGDGGQGGAGASAVEAAAVDAEAGGEGDGVGGEEEWAVGPRKRRRRERERGFGVKRGRSGDGVEGGNTTTTTTTEEKGADGEKHQSSGEEKRGVVKANSSPPPTKGKLSLV
ncbi:FAM192A-like protein, partial [Colletotrichum shisoi]